MNIEAYNFIENLKYMGMGMLGIFIVIGIIITVTYVTNKIFTSRDSEKNS